MLGARSRQALDLALLCLAMATVAVPVAAQQRPGTFLVYSRFQIDEGYSSTVRVTNFNETEAVDVAVKFVCAGDDGFCDSLTTTVSLEPGETRAFEPDDLNVSCGQGFAVAYAVDEGGEVRPFDYLIGTYEVSIQGKGKRREADVAVSFQGEQIESVDGPLLIDLSGGVERGQRLWSDFRSISEPDRKGVRRQGSYLNLVDLSIEAGASNAETSATVEWWTEDGNTNFSTAYRFTCFGRVRLDDINANLLEENHGSAVGWMRVRARGDSVLVGSVSEFGKGSATVRNMFERQDSNGVMNRLGRR